MAITPALINVQLNYKNLAQYKDSAAIKDAQGMAAVAMDWATKEVERRKTEDDNSKAIELQNKIDKERLDFNTQYLTDENMYKDEDKIKEATSAYDQMVNRHKGYVLEANYLNKVQVSKFNGDITHTAGSFVYDTTLKQKHAELQSNVNRNLDNSANIKANAKDRDYSATPEKLGQDLLNLYVSNSNLGALQYDKLKGEQQYTTDALQVIGFDTEKQLNMKIMDNTDLSLQEKYDSWQDWKKNFFTDSNKNRMTDEIVKPFVGTDAEKAKYRKDTYSKVSAYVDAQHASVKGQQLTSAKGKADTRKQTLVDKNNAQLREDMWTALQKTQSDIKANDKEHNTQRSQLNYNIQMDNPLAALNTSIRGQIGTEEALSTKSNAIAMITGDPNQNSSTLTFSNNYLPTYSTETKQTMKANDNSSIENINRDQIVKPYLDHYHNLTNEVEARNYEKEMIAAGLVREEEFTMPDTAENKKYMNYYYTGGNRYKNSHSLIYVTKNASTNTALGDGIAKMSPYQREYFNSALKGLTMETNPEGYTLTGINNEFRTSNKIQDLMSYTMHNIPKEKTTYHTLSIDKKGLRDHMDEYYNNQHSILRNKANELDMDRFPSIVKKGYRSDLITK